MGIDPWELTQSGLPTVLGLWPPANGVRLPWDAQLELAPSDRSGPG